MTHSRSSMQIVFTIMNESACIDKSGVCLKCVGNSEWKNSSKLSSSGGFVCTRTILPVNS